MNTFHIVEKLGKSKTGVNGRYRHAVVYMPSSAVGTRFKYRRLVTLKTWNASVDINQIDPYHQFQHDVDPRPSTAFMIFARSSEYHGGT